MITESQQNYLLHLLKTTCNEIDEIKEWYEKQPKNNTFYNKGANYRDQIILDKIKDADYWLVSGLIGDLEKIKYVSGEVDLDSLIDRINNLK